MNNNLLIVGAGVYGVVAKEIAKSMNCFEEIAFVDDSPLPNTHGNNVIGTIADIPALISAYDQIIVAIGTPDVRLDLVTRIEKEFPGHLTTLISPKAYISPSARIMKGVIIEPFAVVHSECTVSSGCIISAGAVINHASSCLSGVHVDCNATVTGNTFVPEKAIIPCGTVFSGTL